MIWKRCTQSAWCVWPFEPTRAPRARLPEWRRPMWRCPEQLASRSARFTRGARVPQARASTPGRLRSKWSPPEPPPPVAGSNQPGKYAGSAACRECHAQVYDNWKSTGMAKMFRPYDPAAVIGNFSGQPRLPAALSAGSQRRALPKPRRRAPGQSIADPDTSSTFETAALRNGPDTPSIM